ncbi:adhesion G protein-coupled receptor F4 [Sphaeramia orbicularis]|uniref:adhesion G protein-coupled receptor F4 n=1 Tax=Sphaeramia orbicularis TaxID=375764 RepID=UPI0011815AC3|nr:adhesion G protein-coupled receptor F4-like [Sphaeramia orbicularis]
MRSKALIYLVGAVYIYCQVFAQDIYIAELMVESNVTLEAETILSVLNSTTNLQVTDANGVNHTVTLLQSETLAECLIIGPETTCNCSAGYIWSNEVCYNFNCCSDASCSGNVSFITPLCISKVPVRFNGSATLNTSMWDETKTAMLETAFKGLNGFESLNITAQRLDATIVDFETAVSVKFETSKLLGIVSKLESDLKAVLHIDTTGMVTIEAPPAMVCYLSNPELKCTFEEATDAAGWSMSNEHSRFQLNSGTVVALDNACSTPEYQSCVGVRLTEVTGLWAGIYECGFTKGSVRHTARAQLGVALLPDEIIIKINPITGDCSETAVTHIEVMGTATIPKSIQNFTVWWSYRGKKQSDLQPNHSGDYLEYTFTCDISCKESPVAHYFEVTFRNMRDQIKTARVDIPVIYAGAGFCDMEIVNGETWPKTPNGDTAINRTCPEGRVGYKSRTCEERTWTSPYSNCVSEELNKISGQADYFQRGLGATPEVALNIFEGLQNNSDFDSDSSDTIADISASVNILNVMASASNNIPLGEKVLSPFMDAASNMLNNTWATVNNSVLHSMSSTYLESVESLVKNINIRNDSKNILTENLDLKYCSSSECNVSLFDISLNLNQTIGTMKTVAVKNLMDKLRNNFHNTNPTSLLVSATLEDRGNSSIVIQLDFPKDESNQTQPFCVFWNTKMKDWSDVGCTVKTEGNNRTLCECNHLTSFSVLMAKTDVSNDILDKITLVGLIVSICALALFLIIESLVWSAVVKTNLSHFRHTAMVNIATFLLLADCCFLASTSPETLGESWCLIFTVCKHLFYLVKFSWMLCLSVMLVHQLIFVFSPLRKRVFMFLSSIVGYVCPILIVGSSYVYYKYTNKPYYCKKTCWLIYERLLVGSIHAFLLPIGTVVLTNVFSMVVVIVTLLKSSAADGSKADDKDTAKSIIKVMVVLTPVFGVTWGIGFFLLTSDEKDPMFHIANYSFTILNSFQGLFVLLSGCFAEQKVREELIKIVMGKTKGQSDSTKNLTSTTYTKDK